MSSRVPIRMLTSLAAFALIAGTLSATPAIADEPTPTPTVVATPEAEPTAEPTGEPTAEPTSAPTPEATREPAPQATGTKNVTLVGLLTRLTEHSAGAATSRTLFFSIAGQGDLLVDLTKIDLGAESPTDAALTLEIPASLDLGESDTSEFEALETFFLANGPIPAVDYSTASEQNVAGRINQTPAATAVHKVYTVLVTPKNFNTTAPTAGQTVAGTQAQVAQASAFWSAQSGGVVSFQWAGTVPHYKSAYNCTVGGTAESDAINAAGLWSEAAAIAKTQLGYKPGPNAHLALFFPERSEAPSNTTYSCGGAAGLARYGQSINTGGPSWSMGTSSAYSKSTFTHELGHNLTLGHANWADCTSATPQPGFLGSAGCSVYEYGDVTDVMGGGTVDGTGGSLSSPNAIRAGLWSSTAYAYAPPARVSTYTLNSVSSNSGLRSVIVEDNTGSNYFVEYRNMTGVDQQYTVYGCPVSASMYDACSSTAGVRILRAEQTYRGEITGGAYVKGRAADGTTLIGRTVNGVKKASYTAGEFFSTAGITITVTAVTSTTATVTVKRPATALAGGVVKVTRSAFTDNYFRVGDVFTALIGASWEADSYSFQWLRNGKAIKGATKTSYTVSAADKGKAIKLKVTGKVGKKVKVTTDPSSAYSGFGPIRAGVLAQGTVSINSTNPTFLAAPLGWDTPSTVFSYQWLRNGAAIKGAIKASYTPAAADSNTSLSVRVVGSKAGFNSLAATSAARNYTTVLTGGTVGLTVGAPGIARVGVTLSATSTQTFTTQSTGAPVVGPVLSYQWYRNGVAIAGGTNSTYTLVAADYNTVTTVRVSGRKAGDAAVGTLSAPTVKIAKGVIAGNLALPVVSKNVIPELTAALPAGSVTEAGVVIGYQWYRGTAKIAKATKATYKPTALDARAAVKVVVTITKLNYTPVVLQSVAKNYGIQIVAVPTITGLRQVGRPLTVLSPTGTALSFTTADGGVSPLLTYVWYRDGKAIPASNSATYVTTNADFGKKLVARVIAINPGYLTWDSRAATTAKIGKGTFTGSAAAPTVTANGLVLTGALTAGSVSETGTVQTYQWYRGSAKIAKATKASFTLTAADYGKTVFLRIVVAKKNYVSKAYDSVARNYSVTPNTPLPVIAGNLSTATTVTVPGRSYSVNGTGVSPMVDYQWLRNGKPIVGATAAAYALTAEKGNSISVRVTAVFAGALTSVSTSAATQKIGDNYLAGGTSTTPVGITRSAGVSLLTSADSQITEPDVVRAYQWYRSGVAIPKATAATYTPVAADYGKGIWVRIIYTKPNYTTVVRYSATVEVSVIASAKPVISSSLPKRGKPVTVSTPTFSGPGGGDIPVTVSYQWYRSGKKIVGATLATYKPVSADKGKKLTARVVATSPGLVAAVLTSAATRAIK
ncbi:hypothetical protein EYE40_10790 [Glaciihabitans arcticus]|uniref:Peptidase M11 gametolysin domain-containing protein n=1 Tax=Glaciihabitans arcticus TaxID=2668039 RepID=A0A4Q9GS62_9MICO|nr:zinc-dependent metalloprotease family protein [Glaciihabitans arcticus]TBN57836.1 hypothetical protein EYE40_10790 [Glaciihabitans arcticus]